MKRLRVLLGLLVFWLGWPLLFFYLRRGVRTRVLVVNKQSILLVRGWHGGDKWSLPGGGLHRGEEVKTGAAREVKEETGIATAPRLLQHLMDGEHRSHGLAYKYTCFWIELPNQPRPTTRGLEIIEAAWVPLSSLSHQNTHTAVLDYIARWKQRP